MVILTLCQIRGRIMIKIEEDIKLDFQDILLLPRYNENGPQSRSETDLSNNPIILSNMDHVGTFEMSNAVANYNISTALVKHYSVEEYVNFYCSNISKGRYYALYTLGLTDNDLNKLEKVYSKIPKFIKRICLDAANINQRKFLDTVDRLVKEYSACEIWAGNAVTGDQCKKLADHGVNVIKVGLGSGQFCSTRTETGIGFPQFSAILECVQALKEYDTVVCGDGGIRVPGDVVKALVAGARHVMVGTAFAGCTEGYSEEELKNEKLPFYGMSSHTAQKIHNGSVQDYRSSEGREDFIKHKGSVYEIAKRFNNGLRSALTYLGCHSIFELHHSDIRVIKVSRQVNWENQS